MLMPLLNTAATLLESKDDNTTGFDDEAAEAIKFLVERLQKYTESE